MDAATPSSLSSSAPERFGLSWPGKAEAMRAAAEPPVGALVPDVEASVAFEQARHVFIEGENLATLKLLRGTLERRVKVIYIDPPYNTRNDFIYADDFVSPREAYLRFSGQVDGAGRATTDAPETQGRFHAAWLSMMAPRLVLARELLREDGVIFVSIDDREVHHLRMLMDEVFGSENFVGTLVWRKKVVRGRGAAHLLPQTEYVHVYARAIGRLPAFSEPLTDEMRAEYRFSDAQGPYKLIPLAKSGTARSPRPNLVYPIQAPDGSTIPCPTHQWRWSKETLAARRDEVVFRQSRLGKWIVYTKQYLQLPAGERERTPSSYYDRVTTTDATAELKALFGRPAFDFPKPSELIRDIIRWATPAGSRDADVVLDFFAGACPTAQAVLELNAEDGGNRRFVCVQLPVPTEDPEWPTIAELGRERIRRVLSRLASDEGFKALRHVPEAPRAAGAAAMDLDGALA